MEPVFTDNRVLPHIRSALAEVLVIAALDPTGRPKDAPLVVQIGACRHHA